jgi:raffinose/stachyose/melibiose transport system permease protein
MLMVVLAVPFVYPFVFLAFTAIKTEGEYFDDPIGLPSTATLDHLDYVWNKLHLDRAMVNSLTAVGIGVVVCCLIGATAAFWFGRHEGKLARGLLGVVVGFWVIPWVIWLIPFFVLVSQLGLLNNLYALGVVYATLNAPFAVYLLWSYYRQAIPREVLEAAEIDGAGLLQQFVRIILPLSLPALGTVAALAFVYMWGDLLFAVILLQDAEKFTLIPTAATLVGEFQTPVQRMAAGALISMLPMLLVFALAQRAIMRGVIAGVSR